ncbi:hypothetical protein HD554DRAFT_1995990, partial [Boletus coccyginus]
TTVVLHKPDRLDYSILKAYQPITFFNTMAKILSLCVAKDLTNIAEKHQLLFNTHF